MAVIPVTYKPEVELRLPELAANGAHYVALKAPDSVAANVVLTLPPTAGSVGNILRTDGAGALTWIVESAAILAAANSWNLSQTFQSGALSTNPFLGIGYTIGAGGVITQITSKSTGVVLDNVCGRITTHNESLSDATSVSFIVTNPRVAEDDVIIINHKGGGTLGAYSVEANTIAAGSFVIKIRNESGGPLGEALILNYALFKGASF